MHIDADAPSAAVIADLDRRVRDEAWRVMVFVWLAVRAALIPLDLERIPKMLGPYLEHLSRSKNASRSRQIPRFVSRMERADAFG